MSDTSIHIGLDGDIPRGLHHIDVDQSGKLKLPATFHRYLSRQGENTVFITNLEDGILRVYPVSAWLRQRAALWASDTDEARDIYFIAEDRGRDSTIDKRGRMTIHEDLLRLFGEGNQKVVLEFYRGRINIYSQAAYTRQRESARASIKSSLSALRKGGLL